jgi:hypothetical protein
MKIENTDFRIYIREIVNNHEFEFMLMQWKKRIALSVIYCCCFPMLMLCFVVTASFYGASYVTVPLQDARSTTELRLRFRTRRADALLFLAAGRTDYALVRLESGRLKVRKQRDKPNSYSNKKNKKKCRR